MTDKFKGSESGPPTWAPAGQVSALREVLTEKSDGDLLATTLPWAMRIEAQRRVPGGRALRQPVRGEGGDR